MKTITTIILTLLIFPTIAQNKFEKLEQEHNFIQVLNISGFPGKQNMVTPKFINGKAGLDKYIAENVFYPEKAKKENVEGIVVLSYVINTNGEIIDITGSNSTSEILNQAVIDVLSESGPWIPGKKDGKYIKINMSISYEFKN